jgi:hypothetical protein
MLSGLILLYPDKADYWREQMNGVWSQLKKNILKGSRVTLAYPSEILAASVVGSERAWIDQEGLLQVELKTTVPFATQPLPDRPLA